MWLREVLFDVNGIVQMEILKTFISDERPHAQWGFGEDGGLYYRYMGSGSYTLKNPETIPWEKWDKFLPFAPSFHEMQQLVKQFGHLVIFT